MSDEKETGAIEERDAPNKLMDIRDDIWSYWLTGSYIVIPTNGTVKTNGEAVMGRGVALQAKLHFSLLPALLGSKLRNDGNRVHVFPEFRLVTFPVKHEWMDDARIELIERSATQLLVAANTIRKFPVYMPRVGCGNGKLSWTDVKPVLEKILDGRFQIVWNGQSGRN